jgi:hypothetical protein
MGDELDGWELALTDDPVPPRLRSAIGAGSGRSVG